MNYDTWKKEQLATKMHKKTVTGRISSKKPNNVVSETEFRAEKAELAKNQQKTRKKALKATNDAELARRNKFFGSDKPTDSTPNPNAAFRSKKLSYRIAESAGAVSKDFYVPPRYGNLYRSILEDGHSIIYARNAVRGLMKEEEEHPTDNNTVTNEVLDSVRERVKGNLIKKNPLGPSPLQPTHKVRTKQWNPETERYEYEVEDEYERNEDPP